MKKLLIVFACLTVLLSMTACVKRKMKKLVGVYELTTYTKDVKDKPFENLKEKNHVEAYIVFNGDGRGYYVEKSDYTNGYHLYEVEMKTSRDEEKPSLIDGITVKFKYDALKLYGQGRAEYISFKLSGSDADLYHTSISLLPLTTVKTIYKKISSNPKLQVVFDKIGMTLPVLSYDMAYFDGIFEMPSYETNYDYRVFDINIANLKADIYYKEKEGEAVEIKGVDVVVTPNGSEHDLKIGEYSFTTSEAYISYEKLNENEEPYTDFLIGYGDKTLTVQDVINSIVKPTDSETE